MTAPTDSAEWKEFHQQRRIVDMMLTVHSLLRDRYRRRRVALTVLTLGLAVTGAGFAFASNATDVTIAGIRAGRDTWLGILSLLVLFLCVLDLIADWAGRANAHQIAVSRLARLKADMRDVPKAASNDEQPPATIRFVYSDAMDALPAIPERSFNALKARHLRKVEVSTRLSAAPGAAARVIWWRVFLEQSRKR